MNPTDDNLPDHLPTLDDRRFDLLVDGELPESERRNLLSTLDDLPGGWRRCALAFLEAQTWNEQMRSIRQESVSPAQPARSVGRRAFRGGPFRTLLAMAASFLIALGLGLVLHDLWRPGAGAGLAPQIAETAGEPERQAGDADEPDTAPRAPAAEDDWQLVTLPVGFGPGGTGSIQLPAKERDRLDDGWPGELTPAVPADVLQAFEQSGHEVRRHRRLLPFHLDDGRRVVVPFEEVEFRCVGNSAYQ